MVTIHTDANLFRVANNVQTTLTTDVTSVQTTLPLASVAGLSADGGYVSLLSTDDSTPGEEIIKYTGISSNDLTGCTRGVAGTTALNADSGDQVESRVFAELHNALVDGLIVTSQDLADLADGSAPFAKMSLRSGDDGLEFLVTGGDCICEFDQDIGGYALEFSPNHGSSVEPMLRLDPSTGAIQMGADELKLYTYRELGNGAELVLSCTPDVADGSGVTAYLFKSKNDLATSTAAVLEIQNQSTPVLTARASQTEAPKFKATGTGAGLNVPVLSADPGSPSNGDIWLYSNGGTTEVRCRMGGVTLGVAVA